MSLPSAARLLELAKLRCKLFGTSFNPTNVRTGAKVLKARMRGPSMLAYYGVRMSGWRYFNKKIEGLDLPHLEEQQRLDDIEARRRRGKVTPKKGLGKRASLKKR